MKGRNIGRMENATTKEKLKSFSIDVKKYRAHWCEYSTLPHLYPGMRDVHHTITLE